MVKLSIRYAGTVFMERKGKRRDAKERKEAKEEGKKGGKYKNITLAFR
jgi:hypothetical protein